MTFIQANITLSTLPGFNLLVASYQGKLQIARSQPDDLAPLCKYLQFTGCEYNQFLQK